MVATEKPPVADSKAPSSDAGTGDSEASEPAAPPKPRSNPFGAARPREEVLKEQGRDWRKEELELAHKSVQRCRAICEGLCSICGVRSTTVSSTENLGVWQGGALSTLAC